VEAIYFLKPIPKRLIKSIDFFHMAMLCLFY